MSRAVESSRSNLVMVPARAAANSTADRSDFPLLSRNRESWHQAIEVAKEYRLENPT